MIPKKIIDFKKNKIINFNNSFLPLNRGYHPLFWAIFNKTVLGVTIHLIDEGIDTLKIIYQKNIRYKSTDTLRVLYDKQRLTFFDLFKKNWSQIKKSNFKLKSNNKKKVQLDTKKIINYF